MLKDRFQRNIRYVRLSLTDRCNFQCFYCRPRFERSLFVPSEETLSAKDIVFLFDVLGKAGVTHVKLTGGEPLLRKDLEDIVCGLSQNKALQDISLTTNGFFLEKRAQSLKLSGLHRLNVSLDSLSHETFQRITEVPCLDRVWKGIEKAMDVGLSPLKLNIVLMKGINDHESDRFVDLIFKFPLSIRFIEFMPTLRTCEDQKKYFVSNQTVIQEIEKKYTLIPDLTESLTGPSRYYKIQGALGEIGFISPLSNHFCDRCNRIRISSKGKLRLCLFSGEETPLLPLIRQRDEGALEKVFGESLMLKPWGHTLQNGDVGNVASFVNIGG